MHLPKDMEELDSSDVKAILSWNKKYLDKKQHDQLWKSRFERWAAAFANAT